MREKFSVSLAQISQTNNPSENLDKMVSVIEGVGCDVVVFTETQLSGLDKTTSLDIIGLFNSVHYVVGVTAYDKYPLRYGAESRCDYMPKVAPIEGSNDMQSETNAKEDCLKSLDKEILGSLAVS